MDRDTLIAALVGALIATVPILITNLVQIYLHISENRRKDKEAKIQVREKWTERDILRIMDAINEMLELLSELRTLTLDSNGIFNDMENPLFTPDEIRNHAKVNHHRQIEILYKCNQIRDTISRFVFSFQEDEIHSGYEEFTNAVVDFMGKRVSVTDLVEENEVSAWSDVGIKAGYFHKVLREKLISIRA